MKYKSQSGFTIVELLIVVIVIAILATITIVGFTTIQNRAKESAAQAASSQAAKKLAVSRAENSDRYPIDKATFLSQSGLTEASGAGAGVTNGTTYQYTAAANGSTYCLTTTTNGVSYRTSSASQNPTKGGCDGDGVNGAVAITNLVRNPALRTSDANWSSASSSGGNVSGQRVNGLAGMSDFSFSSAYRVTSSIATTGWWRARMYTLPVEAGETYTLSATMRPSSLATTSAIIHWQGSISANNYEVSSAGSHQQNTWQRRSVTALAPAGATSAHVYFNVNGGTNTPAGMTLDTTAVMFYKGPEGYSFADGETPGWLWSGSVNNSTSSGSPLN